MDAPSVQYARAADGFSIAYCVIGEGRPLVLLPEPMSDLLITWSMPARNNLYQSLAERFQLIRYDERGDGMSQRDLPSTVAATDFVLDIEAVVDRLNLERFILFSGIGMSDRAVRYAVRHPDRVAALLLWNPNAGDPAVTIRLYADVAQSSWDLFLDTVSRSFGFDTPELERQRLSQASSMQDFLRKIGSLKDEGVVHLLPEISVPTLVMATRGRSVPVESEARHVASLVPSSRLVVFDMQGQHTSLYRTDGQLPPAIPAIEEFLATAGLSSIEGFATSTAGKADAPAPDKAGLSQRELEVLRLIAAGRSNQQIADELVISQNTVIRHVSNIFGKIGAANRTEAASYAHAHDLN
ncbi:MAG TPA: LuxR C-terminal-related transcriptional regulator [Dehalococcoidia bacterium]|jgi:DNA-binding CsgD family transcriptional regulator/pimeloyl-ACP methyl ester carboxylesterase|nr:LuxR C-terminal-related transcriptional regulator [Dehalococcoidia bacterium]